MKKARQLLLFDHTARRVDVNTNPTGRLSLNALSAARVDVIV